MNVKVKSRRTGDVEAVSCAARMTSAAKVQSCRAECCSANLTRRKQEIGDGPTSLTALEVRETSMRNDAALTVAGVMETRTAIGAIFSSFPLFLAFASASR